VDPITLGCDRGEISVQGRPKVTHRKAFIAPLDEVVITRFIIPAGQVQTLAVHIFTQIRQSISPVIASSSVDLAVLGLVVTIAASQVERARGSRTP
jgi:ABC-type spermidine/putrescine transport system permease subunit II